MTNRSRLWLTILLVALLQPAMGGGAIAQSPRQTTAAGNNDSARDMPGATIAGDLPSPKEHLANILDQSLYQRWKLRQTKSEVEALRSRMQWLRDWQRKVDDWLDRLFRRKPRDTQADHASEPSAFSFGAMLRVVAWIVAASLVILLLVVMYRMIQDWRAQPAQTATISRRKLQQAMKEGHALAASSPVWLAEADRLAQANDIRMAFRAIYLALLSGLHASNRIDYRRNRTNWVYVNRFRGSDDHRHTFAQLTGTFDDVWYGLHTAQLSSLDQIRQRVTRLLEEATPQHA